MRKLTRGTWGRSLAVVTCFAFLTTTLLASLAVAPPGAQAQIGGVEPAVKPPPRAAVVEFEAPAGAMLGSRAAAAVSVAMREMPGAPYLPDPAASVDTALQELGLIAPLDREGQQQLGEHMALKWVIGGTVRRARVVGGKAEVELLVTLLSVESGDYATGALVRASSAAPPGYRGDDDILIDRALSTAARDAARLLGAGRIPEATVLMVFGDNEVQLSDGRPAGLLVGMRLALLRLVEGHWRRVGTLEVTESDDHHAAAAIIANPRGIMTGDRVMAIWEPAQAKVGVVTKPPERKGKGFLRKGLLPLLGIVLGIMIFRQHSNRPEKQRSSTPTACAFADGDGVVVSWAVPDVEVLAVEIWRIAGGVRTLAAAVGREGPLSGDFHQGQYIDRIDAPAGSLCITLDEQTGIATYDGTTGAADPCEVESDVAGRGIVWTEARPEDGVPALVDGVPVSYQLVFIAKKRTLPTDVGDDEGEVTWQLIDYKPSKVSNPATPLAPVTLVRPIATTGENPTSTEFRFIAEGDPDVVLPTTGANQYVIQISRDPSFTPGQTGEYPAPPDYHRNVYAPGDEVRLDIDFSDMLTPAERAGCVQLFWRVGARNLADRCLPVAFPEDPARADWVFGPTTNIGMFTAGATCS